MGTVAVLVLHLLGITILRIPSNSNRRLGMLLMGNRRPDSTLNPSQSRVLGRGEEQVKGRGRDKGLIGMGSRGSRWDVRLSRIKVMMSMTFRVLLPARTQSHRLLRLKEVRMGSRR